MKNSVFTPKDMKGKRLRMHISIRDFKRFEKAKLTEWIKITNVDNGKKYFARRVDCGLDCFCDAQVKLIEQFP
ncbi:hypothetical protein HY637_00680 [Candidatus Woesearchaeota archaeon]|nr:hypothetical protein [Candidatus Woesearchaeota archaeon]